MRSLAHILLLAGSLLGDEMVSRFLQRTDPPLVEYVAARRLEARNDRFHVEGWLEACVTQSPGSGLTYAVTSEGGSSYIRNKVLRKALDGEQQLVAEHEASRAQLSVDNYEIAVDDAPRAAGEVALRLRAKRKDGLLINGRAIVSDPEADLLRVEGLLTKTPSWWTRSVEVMRRYAWRNGIRVPVETTSVADVRLAGRSTFRMTSDYLSINGAGVIRPDSAVRPCLVTQN